ncbi:MAG: lysozyme [Bdellovibrionales bacterium]|nr:lysozyme [Bdellovibrionales bacterium]
MNNKIIKETLDLIKHYEQLNDNDASMIGLQPKMDSNGIWTSGYGRALVDKVNKRFLKGNADKQKAYEIGTVKDEAQACSNLDEDLQPFANEINKAIKIPLTNNEFGALVSLAMNIGFSWLTKTIIPAINGGNKKLATDTMLKYIYSSAGKLPGLYARRLSEVEFFYTGKLVFYAVDKNFNAKAIV